MSTNRRAVRPTAEGAAGPESARDGIGGRPVRLILAVVAVIFTVFVLSAAPAPAQVFQVVGTCADGQCGLNIRNAPAGATARRSAGSTMATPST